MNILRILAHLTASERIFVSIPVLGSRSCSLLFWCKCWKRVFAYTKRLNKERSCSRSLTLTQTLMLLRDNRYGHLILIRAFSFIWVMDLEYFSSKNYSTELQHCLNIISVVVYYSCFNIFINSCLLFDYTAIFKYLFFIEKIFNQKITSLFIISKVHHVFFNK